MNRKDLTKMLTKIKQKYKGLPPETRLSIRCFLTQLVPGLLFLAALLLIERTR